MNQLQEIRTIQTRILADYERLGKLISEAGAQWPKSFHTLLKIVADVFQVEQNAIRDRNKFENVSEARHAFASLSYCTKLNRRDIAAFLDNRSIGTVWWGIRQGSALCETDKKYRAKVDECYRQFTAALK